MKTMTLLLIAMLPLYGCTTESAQRLTYNTLQNAKQQECFKQLKMECPPSESYDDYKRKRDGWEQK